MKFIKDGVYPILEWEIRRDNPLVSFPTPLTPSHVLPLGYEEVQPVVPTYDPTLVASEGPPEKVNGQWQQTWVYTNKPADSLLEEVRKSAQEVIYNVYPTWFQLNCANGIYPTSVVDKMKTDIAAVITESNRCEDLIVQGQPFTINWPTIGV